MGIGLSWLGRRLAGFLTKPVHIDGTVPASLPEHLVACLVLADVLLVESHSRVSTAIKYLSQSTWSHAALYVGSHLAEAGGNPAHCFIKADLIAGVRGVGIDMFAGLHTRICRAVGLTDDDRRAVTSFAIQRLGHRYDLRNIIDLVRYLLPTPPVPLSISPAHDRAGKWRSDSRDLFDADCAGLSIDQISYFAPYYSSRREQDRLPRLCRRNPADSAPQPVCAARFRRLAVFSGDQAQHFGWLRFQGAELGRPAARA